MSDEYDENGLLISLMESIIEANKRKITTLRIELKDALGMAYGARMNWPKSALAALEESAENNNG